MFAGIVRVCTHVSICGPDEEQSGFVAFTMGVESGGKCDSLNHSSRFNKTP